MTVTLAPLLASIGSTYQEVIVDTNREPQFLCILAFLVAFGFIRTSAHMIRAQVSWWPGNVEVGGAHIHHLVWGIIALLVFGYLGVAVNPNHPWREVAAIGFGIGAGLTLDEFALWLNLKDVYWTEQGRRSIDAVVAATALSLLALVGFHGWVRAADDVKTAVFTVVGVQGVMGIALMLINVAKDKYGLALLGLLCSLISLIGALRLGKPHSLWAKLFYGDGKRKRSNERYAGSRNHPFWKRGPELLGRLGFRRFRDG
ncbi:MAG: hypothetical protein FJW90_02215 [Actinobacteria bacterium]|nr:hypothetical protein [Actinomycetota bacterium]